MTSLFDMDFFEPVMIVLVAAACIYGLYKALSRKSVRDYNVDQLLGQAHSYYYYVAAVIGAVGYVYRHWKKAPSGLEKIGWELVLCAMLGYIVFAVVKSIDAYVNRSDTRKVSEQPSIG